jgi:hypothetical protein
MLPRYRQSADSIPKIHYLGMIWRVLLSPHLTEKVLRWCGASIPAIILSMSHAEGRGLSIQTLRV